MNPNKLIMLKVVNKMRLKFLPAENPVCSMSITTQRKPIIACSKRQALKDPKLTFLVLFLKLMDAASKVRPSIENPVIWRTKEEVKNSVVLNLKESIDSPPQNGVLKIRTKTAAKVRNEKANRVFSGLFRSSIDWVPHSWLTRGSHEPQTEEAPVSFLNAAQVLWPSFIF